MATGDVPFDGMIGGLGQFPPALLLVVVLKLADKTFNPREDSLPLVLQGEDGSGKSYPVLRFVKKMLAFCTVRGITCAYSNSSGW